MSVFRISRDRYYTTSLGSLFQMSATLTMKFFPALIWNFLCSIFCLLPLVQPFACHQRFFPHHLDSHALCVCRQRCDLLSALSSPGWRPRSLSISSYMRCFRPLITSIALCYTLSRRSLFEMESPKLDTLFQIQPHHDKTEKDHFPRPAGHTPFNAPWIILAFLATRAHCWFMTNLFTRTLSSFSSPVVSP